jgi:hypothetical protein
MSDLQREHHRKKEPMSDLWETEKEQLIPLPRESFRVFNLEKGKTDKYSFVQIDSVSYSTSPEYAECEMNFVKPPAVGQSPPHRGSCFAWLEIGTSEVRILNKYFEFVAAHTRRYDKPTEPVIDFENYIGTLSRKPRAFLNSPYFLTLPERVQTHLKACKYADLKKMLLALVPIIRDGKIGDAEAVLELVEIKNTDDFETAYEDIKFPNGLSVDDLMNVNFVPRRENLILYGNVGAGKTHLAIAMGVAACDIGFKTRFWQTPALVNALVEAKNEGRLSKFMQDFDKLDLLICDEWGYIPIDSDGSKAKQEPRCDRLCRSAGGLTKVVPSRVKMLRT